MKVLFEEVRIHARGQGMQHDNCSYKRLQALPMGQATIKDKEQAARGALRKLYQTLTLNNEYM